MEERCKFSSKYFDLESKRYVSFNCEESPLPAAKYCIFHDDLYYSKYPEKIVENLQQKLANTSQGGNLLIIGYNIPGITVSQYFGVPVYFNESKFYGSSNFAQAVFDHSVSFEGCEFMGQTEFNLCHFQYVNFSGAKFNKLVFSRVFFSGETYFLLSLFRKQVKFISPKLLDSPDRIRFDYSKFEEGASFWTDILPSGKKDIDLRSVISFEGVDLSNIQFSGSYKYGNFKDLRISLWQFFSDRIAGHLWVFFIGILFLAFSVYYFFGTPNPGSTPSTGQEIIAAITGSFMGGTLKALSILKARVNRMLLDNGTLKRSNNLEFIRIIGGGILSGLLIYTFIDLLSAKFGLDINLIPSTIIVFLSSIAAYNINFLIIFFNKTIKIIRNVLKSKSAFIYEYEKEYVSEEEVFEYEQIRKIVIVALPALIFIFLVSLIYTSRQFDQPRALFFLQIVLLNFVIGHIFRILFQVRRKDFRYNFAKTCMAISYSVYSNQKNEMKSIRYLISGLKMYNKYLQKEFNVEIKELEKIFSKLICDSRVAKQMFVNSIKNCFNTEDKFEPLRYVSIEYLNLSDTEQFLIRGQFVNKLRDFAIFLATVIPVIISIVQILSAHQK